MYSLQLTLITATDWLPDSKQFVQRIPFEGCAEKLLPEWVGRCIKPDFVVVDPPWRL
ncbi:hypothetical protein [Paenibacillus chitinolyticus]|uniref:hypothetical protein n=1 Tax=Paenibacillus chitinolyticus TaxID=79263 RepID=UPI00365F3F23